MCVFEGACSNRLARKDSTQGPPSAFTPALHIGSKSHLSDSPEYPEGHKRAPPDRSVLEHSLKNPGFNGIGAAGAAGHRSCAAGPSLAASQAAFHLRHTDSFQEKSVMTHFLAFSIRYRRASFVVASLDPCRARIRESFGESGPHRTRWHPARPSAYFRPAPRRAPRTQEDPEIAAAVRPSDGTWASASRVSQRRSRLHGETSEAGARCPGRRSGVAMVEEDGLVYTAGWQTLDGGDSWGLDRVDQRRIVGDLGLTVRRALSLFG